jgi:glycosyltransferase involved in cell wall biosynthesis
VATVSVIIPNTDSLLIGDILRALRAQRTDLSQVEVLVVGTDAPGLVQEDRLVRFIPTEHTACASDKRNRGMQEAQGEIFMFLDDDCIHWPDWIARHLNRHRQGECIVGGALALQSRNYLQLADNLAVCYEFLPFMAEGKNKALSVANLSIQRPAVQHGGMFASHLKVGEDSEWLLRLRSYNYSLFFEPRAVAIHARSRTWNQIMRRWMNNGFYSIHCYRYLHNRASSPITYASHHRWLFLWGAPLVAAWLTIRTFQHPQTQALLWHTLPAVYLLKLLWSFGASRMRAVDSARWPVNACYEMNEPSTVQ